MRTRPAHNRFWSILLTLLILGGVAWGQTAEEAEQLNEKFLQLYSEGRYAEAIPLGQKVLSIRGKVLGPEHPDTATSLNNLAVLYWSMGEYQQALPLYKRALAISEKVLGPEHLLTATSLNNLAGLYGSMGDYQQALPLYKRALAVREKVLGPEHPDTATSLNNLAALYESSGDYHQALPLYKRSLAIREKVLGPEHPDTADSLNNLAGIYESTGEYEEALRLYKRALAVWEKALGPEHPNTATGLHNLANLHKSKGEYEQALRLYRRALIIREKVLGLEHPNTTNSLNNLAVIYESIGDYKEALPLYKRALATREKVLGPEHPSTATSLDNLAGFLESIGDYEQALPLCKRALAIYEKALGPEHPDTATSLNNLAYVYKSKGDYKQALPLYKRALAIEEKVLGPEHPDTATSLNNLAGLRKSTGDYERALTLYKRALAIYEKALGPEHPDTATGLNNLAYVYKSKGDYKQALPLYKRALAVREKVLGPEHPDTATSLSNLAHLQIDLGSKNQALKLVEQKASSTLATTTNIFTFASERQRLNYQEKQGPYDLFGTLASGPNLIQQALRYKGLVLDSMVEDMRLAEASLDPATRELAVQVKSIKSQLNQIVFNTPTDLDEEAREKRARRKAELKKQLEDLQSQLARQGVEQGNLRRAFTITPKQLQNVLRTDFALVEFLRYNHYLGKNEWETRYGAVILPKQGEPVWAPLPGKAEDLETLISTYKKLVRNLDFTRAVPLAPDTYDQGTETAVLKELYQQVWLPVDKALPEGTRTVIISPDGELNFLSFATLLTPDERFLAEEYTLTYVSSGRDLVANTSKKPQSQTLLVGDPAFGEAVQQKESNSALSRAVDTRDWQQMSFAPLPYTRAECQGLEKLFQQRQQKVTALFSESATEAQLRQVQAPETLHMATHGYFLPEPEVNKKARGAHRMDGQEFDLPLKDPMYRSGLALAGAQTTVQLRANGKSPDFRNDGLLTAAEVGILNLSGTRLVTLSACDTGSGESRAGEGVLGLRRGFVQAGARNLIMTLWPVADKETSELMQEFYIRADSRPAPLAMAEVQKEWLTRLRAEKSLSEAVRLAGPFVLSFQGRLKQ